MVSSSSVKDFLSMNLRISCLCQQSFVKVPAGQSHLKVPFPSKETLCIRPGILLDLTSKLRIAWLRSKSLNFMLLINIFSCYFLFHAFNNLIRIFNGFFNFCLFSFCKRAIISCWHNGIFSIQTSSSFLYGHIIFW